MLLNVPAIFLQSYSITFIQFSKSPISCNLLNTIRQNLSWIQKAAAMSVSEIFQISSTALLSCPLCRRSQLTNGFKHFAAYKTGNLSGCGFYYINHNLFLGCKKEMWMDKRNVEKNSGRIPPSLKDKYSNEGHVVCDDSSFCNHPKKQLNIYIASFLSERDCCFYLGFSTSCACFFSLHKNMQKRSEKKTQKQKP